LERSFDQVRKLTSIDDKPLIVLTASGGSPADEPAVAVQLWLTMQASLGRLSTRGIHRVVPDTGHMIPLEAPGAVVQAVVEAVDVVRSPQLAPAR